MFRASITNIRYLGEPGADAMAIAVAREPLVIASNADFEALNTVDRNLQPNPRFQTETELLGRVRARYDVSKGEETCRVAKWIVDRLGDGSITTAQCQAAWGVTAAGWNAINGRMDNYASSIASVDSAVGE